MNHYERLKVSRDAPAEVIRAAYRALAAKMHPDRQGSETGPDDVTHTQMAALNGAYEILIDPRLREDYDATLMFPQVTEAGSDADQESRQGPSTRVDMEWLAPKVATSQTLWPPSQRMMVLGGGVLAVVILACSSLWWQAGQQKMERALSGQYASPSTGARADVAAPYRPQTQSSVSDETVDKVIASVAKNRPTVEQLSRMSDEELLKVLPTMDQDAAEPAPDPIRRNKQAAAPSRHPLDGVPIGLRTDAQLLGSQGQRTRAD